MERDPDRTPDDLNRQEGNTLRENYSKHDVAQAHFEEFLVDLGVEVEQWGIDKRADGGEDGLIYDDKLDTRLWDDSSSDDEEIGRAEIKAKTSESWFGVINLRHYVKYLEQCVGAGGIPHWIYMTRLERVDDIDGETRWGIARDCVIPLRVPADFQDAERGFLDQYDSGEQLLRDDPTVADQVVRTFVAPDGNRVVKLDEDDYMDVKKWAFQMGVRVGTFR